jgi:hypothetical protein
MTKKVPRAAHRATAAWGRDQLAPDMKTAVDAVVQVADRYKARVDVAVASEVGLAPGVYAGSLSEMPGGKAPAELWAVPPDWHPRATDVPDLRAQLVAAWAPGGDLARIAPMIEELRPGGSGPVGWERETLQTAALWYVGGDMCDLLVGAAPGLPSVELTRELCPDPEGLVVFERCLIGLDAEGSGAAVATGAMLWGRAKWLNPWGPPLPGLGVTIYRPVLRAGLAMMPIGSLVWPLGFAADYPLAGDPATDASMAEDRRRLAALWLLSAQPGLATTTEAALPRHVVRRAQRAGQLPRVRVVRLREAPGDHRGAQSEGGRTYHHRWAVAGHWRQQAWGPRHSQRRPTYINPYLKGPEGAPLVDRPVVKAWTR